MKSPQERAYDQLMAAFDEGVEPTLSTEDHVLAAYVAHQREYADDQGPWRSNLWTFTRLMKAHPDLKDKSGKFALARVEKVISGWPVECQDVRKNAPIVKKAELRWPEWFYVEAEDARVEFISNWDSVRCLPGYSPLKYAIEQADDKPMSFSEDDEDLDRSPGYVRFLSIAGWLQVANGNRGIMLPVERISHLLGVEPMTVSRYRKWAVQDGFLRIVKLHHFNPKKGAGEATQFRFDVSLVPMFKEQAHDACEEAFEHAEQEKANGCTRRPRRHDADPGTSDRWYASLSDEQFQIYKSQMANDQELDETWRASLPDIGREHPTLRDEICQRYLDAIAPQQVDVRQE